MPFDDATRRQFLRRMGALTGLLAGDALLPARASANALHVGSAAPPAVLSALSGERIATADLLGRVVILTFWATWCVPCRQELPLLSQYAADHADRGLTVLGFSLDTPDRLAQVTEIAQTLAFPVGLLANSSAPGYGRMWKIPVNFTIARDGRLVDDGWRARQPVWTQERLDAVVTPLLEA